MSSRTKKPLIDKKSEEEFKSIKTTEQLYRDYDLYLQEQIEEQNRKRNKLAEALYRENNEGLGIEEVEANNRRREEERNDCIRYIIKNAEGKFCTNNELYEMDYDEVKRIYLKAQDTKKSWFRKIIEVFT